MNERKSSPPGERLACPKCNHQLQTASTIGKADHLAATCPGCREKFPLGEFRAAAKPVKGEIVDEPVPPTALTPLQENLEAQVTTHVARPTPPNTSIREHSEMPVPENSDVSRFAADGQDVAMITRLLGRVQEICTSAETPLYMAVQQKPIANFSPDAVVLTNKRFIFFRQKVLGRMDFIDCLWMHVANVHMKENLVGATVTLQGQSGRVECIDYLPKIQARRVYRVAQEMEESMIEFRRDRMMEEQRNAANQVVVQNALTPSPAPVEAGSDPVVKLQQIKQMLDAGLIEQDEYDQKKASILESM